MGNDDDARDIFDAAAKMSGGSKKKKLSSDEIARKRKERMNAREKAYIEKKAEYDDVDAAFQRAKEMHDEIDEKINRLYRAGRFDPKQFESFMKDPGNFSSEQWNKLADMRRQYEGRIWEAVGDGAKKKIKSKEKRKKSSKHSRKFLGLRKKGWMQMD